MYYIIAQHTLRFIFTFAPTGVILRSAIGWLVVQFYDKFRQKHILFYYEICIKKLFIMVALLKKNYTAAATAKDVCYCSPRKFAQIISSRIYQWMN